MISPSHALLEPRPVPPCDCRPLTALDRLARRWLGRTFQRLVGGRLRVIDADGQHVFGERAAVAPACRAGAPNPEAIAVPARPAEAFDPDLEATVIVQRPAFYRHAVLGGNLSIAESYLRGDWSCSDLTPLFRLFARNIALSDSMDQGLRRLLHWPARLYHWLHANSRRGSQRNIHLHYDLGNDFFSLMLDETLAYSSGIYPRASSSLYEASIEKMDRLCRKLDLRPSDQLLEIGTGWGGLAIHAAQNYGCRVTTTTISREQHQEAAQRVARAGLGDRVTVLLCDYRDLAGTFDKIVSVEMVEAVGHEYLPDYFGQLSRLLRPSGTAALQAIVIGEQRHAQYLRSVDFIQRYVFPGGCLPSVGSLIDASGRGSDLRLVHLEDFAEHYAHTLADWRQRFLERIEDVRRLGYPERFLRLWNYYLCYCEAGFAERYLSVAHLQFDKPDCLRDPLNLTRRAAESGASSAAAVRRERSLA